jgi:hypothetical protein
VKDPLDGLKSFPLFETVIKTFAKSPSRFDQRGVEHIILLLETYNAGAIDDPNLQDKAAESIKPEPSNNRDVFPCRDPVLGTIEEIVSSG